MANINFDTLVLRKDWAGALQSIIDEAADAIAQNDDDKKIALQALLKTFIKRSPTMVDDLDDIALKSIDDLTNSVIADAITGIKKRNDDLKAATKKIEDAADEAQKDAKTIQLKTVIDVLDRSKAAVETLKNLEKRLASPDQDLLAKIAATTAAIEELLKLAKSKEKKKDT